MPEALAASPARIFQPEKAVSACSRLAPAGSGPRRAALKASSRSVAPGAAAAVTAIAWRAGRSGQVMKALVDSCQQASRSSSPVPRAGRNGRAHPSARRSGRRRRGPGRTRDVDRLVAGRPEERPVAVPRARTRTQILPPCSAASSMVRSPVRGRAPRAAGAAHLTQVTGEVGEELAELQLTFGEGYVPMPAPRTGRCWPRTRATWKPPPGGRFHPGGTPGGGGGGGDLRVLAAEVLSGPVSWASYRDWPGPLSAL
jgi:hypothetical protein